MVFSAIRKASLTVALMLGCAVIPAQAGWFNSDDKPAAKADSKPAAPFAVPAANSSAVNGPGTNLEDSIRQAQLLRLAGQYPEAIKHLSQLMLVASDDPRVISEYGKTLTSMGRATDAVNFLTRAQQLQPTDWTLYSAMGVAYDQLGDQANAKDAYEHALALKPEEPSVLSNYALSRMLAKDPDMARKLVARAESANIAGDDKIARNIAMIRSLAPEAGVPPPVAMAAPAQSPAAATLPAKVTVQAPATHDNRVVMQRVPVDPLAGPVAKPVPQNTVATAVASTASNGTNGATHAPRPLLPQAAADASPVPAPKPVTFATLPPLTASVKAAPTAAAKLVSPAPAKSAETASASVTLRMAPLNGEADKPGQAPKVLPSNPVKAAAKSKDDKPGAIPGLRVSANAY
jgi:Flp pilus assembly protein TadD